MNNLKKFSLKNKNIIITGGAGLLGEQHVYAIVESGGTPVIYDSSASNLSRIKKKLKSKNIKSYFFKGSVASEKHLLRFKKFLRKNRILPHVLINNAALNPKLNKINSSNILEKYSIKDWNAEIEVGLTGAFLTSKVIGSLMVSENIKGIIINISSDLGLVAPDNRIYNDDKKIVIAKPVTYSVIKHGIIGLTKYLATYWASKNIRSNCLCPGGVYENQNKKFVKKISKLIPLGRMARLDEYKGAIQFLCSDASSYMNGSNLIIDGGRTIW
tara:strand:- start:1340 stop:2152 length:813 start_codon:yes stop_codon:yes gene_type:complete